MRPGPAQEIPNVLPRRNFHWYCRYSMTSRNLPALRELRASYIGRALHTTPGDWKKQAGDIPARA